MAVSIAPIGVVPCRKSNIAGTPPQTMGVPGLLRWRMAIPFNLSAARWTTKPSNATGAAAPANGNILKTNYDSTDEMIFSISATTFLSNGSG